MRSKTPLRLSVTDVFFVSPPINFFFFFPSLTSRRRDKERCVVEESGAVSEPRSRSGPRYKRRISKGIKMLIIQAGCASCFKPHEICMAQCEPYWRVDSGADIPQRGTGG